MTDKKIEEQYISKSPYAVPEGQPRIAHRFIGGDADPAPGMNAWAIGDMSLQDTSSA